MVIKKLKERIKYLSGNMNEDKVKKDIEEIKKINIKLDHKVSKLIAENEHLKQTYKQLYDSIKPAQMLKIDVEYLNPRLLNNRSAHSDYLKHTQEEAAILMEIVKQGKSQNPLNESLDSALRNVCPLTSITTTTEVLLRKTAALENETPKLVVTLDYSRKPRKYKTSVPVSKSKVVQIVLWYLDSGCSKHMIEDRSQLTNFVNKFLGTAKFRNDHVAKILGYGDYQIRNVTISRVYYVEGLGHKLFFVEKFCDSNLEVAFRQHTCFIRNLEGVDLLTGSQGNNLYTLSLGDMMASSLIYHMDLSFRGGYSVESCLRPPHSTIFPFDSDIENTFSSMNILNYFPASPGRISPDSSNNFTKYFLDILVFLPLHDDSKIEVIQAYDAIPPPQVVIALPAILPPSPVLSLSLMFASQDLFPSKKISPKDTETPVESPIPVPPSLSEGSSSPVRSTTPDYLFDESFFAKLDNSLWIISRLLGSKPVPEDSNESDAC
nr:integrase, catalytic region, zinc finger, CCHC-type, peptidase aspartic, catalytic [Tanacetum cinerariifolium]